MKDIAVREKMFAMISEWQQSGLSQKTFCEQRQIASHRFHYWYKRYRQRGDSTEASAVFVPLKVTAHSCQAEVVMPSGVRIVFHQPVTASFLHELIK